MAERDLKEPLMNKLQLEILISGYCRENCSQMFETVMLQDSILNFTKNDILVIDSTVWNVDLEHNKDKCPHLLIENKCAIKCSAETVIEIKCDILYNNGVIDASECGPQCQSEGVYSDGCGKGGEFRNNKCSYSGASHGVYGSSSDVSAGKIYGNKELTKLYFGSGSMGNFVRGGGIIIISCNRFVNTQNGIIKCNGDDRSCSGGSILIVTNIFTNNGSIQSLGGEGLTKVKYVFGQRASKIYLSGGHGRIAIYASVTDNGGTIEPDPYFGEYLEGLDIIKNIESNRKEYIVYE